MVCCNSVAKKLVGCMGRLKEEHQVEEGEEPQGEEEEGVAHPEEERVRADDGDEGHSDSCVMLSLIINHVSVELLLRP